MDACALSSPGLRVTMQMTKHCEANAKQKHVLRLAVPYLLRVCAPCSFGIKALLCKAKVGL